MNSFQSVIAEDDSKVGAERDGKRKNNTRKRKEREIDYLRKNASLNSFQSVIAENNSKVGAERDSKRENSTRKIKDREIEYLR